MHNILPLFLLKIESGTKNRTNLKKAKSKRRIVEK
jgi:hypothetical protein